MSFVDLTEVDDGDGVVVAAAAKKHKGDLEDPVLLDDDNDNDDDSIVQVPAAAARPPKSTMMMMSDFEMAKKLSAQWNKEDSRRKRKMSDREAKAEKAMKSTITGKSLSMVQRIIQLVDEVKRDYPKFKNAVETIGTDDMVFLAEKLLQTQQTFANQRIPAHADIGYHYTQPECLNSIRENGLLSKAERDAKNVASSIYNGSALGDGIYTANNPFLAMGQGYGDAGLMVVRLMGRTVMPRSPNGNTYSSNPADPSNFGSVNVLKTCGQCLPMIKFSASKVIRQREPPGAPPVRNFAAGGGMGAPPVPNFAAGGGMATMGRSLIIAGPGAPPAVAANYASYVALNMSAGYGYGAPHATTFNKQDHKGVACLVRLHEGLQEIVDEYLNNGKPTNFEIHNMQGQLIHQYKGRGHRLGSV